MSNFDDLVKSYEEMMKEVQAKGQSMIKAAFDEAFEAHPDVKAIIWTQYTPYWNDGEECVFGVNDFVITNSPNGKDIEYVGDKGDTFVEHLYANNKDKWSKFHDIEKFANTPIGSDIFKTLFGDHIKVTAVPGEFIVDEYEHD